MKGADDGVGDGLHGFALADDALVENLIEVQEFLFLVFAGAGGGNGPGFSLADLLENPCHR